MPEQLEAVLNLDYSDALSAISDLEERVNEAFADVTLGLDTSALDDLTSETVEIPVETDTSAVIGEIEAIPEAAPDVEIPVGADTTGAVSEIDSITGQEVTIPVDADVTPAEEKIGGLDDQEVTVTANVEGGEQVDDLNESLTETAPAAGGGATALDGASTAATALGATASASQGKLGGLTGVLSSIGPGGAQAGAGILIAATAIGTLFTAGLKGVAANERLNVVFGDMAGAVQKIDIGGLNGQLGDLALKTGSSGAALKQSVARLGEFAISSGKSKDQAAGFTEQVSALSLRAVALNPQLGEAGEVADRLGLALARGGRSAARYGIDLKAAEINQRALADTGKTVVSDLTQVEKAMAGAELATEKLGGKLGTDFSKGVDQTAVKLKAMQAELAAAFGQAGAPLVDPLVKSLQSLVPVLTAVTSAIGTLGTAVATGLSVPLEQASGILESIPAPLQEVGLAAGVAALGLRKMGEGSVVAGFENLYGSFVKNRTAIGAVGGAIGLAGIASQNATEAVLGLAVAGGAMGAAFGPVGIAVGAAIGGLAGFAATSFQASQSSKEFDNAQQSLAKGIKGASTPAIIEAYTHIRNMKFENEKATSSWEVFGIEVGKTVSILGLVTGEQEKNTKQQQQAKIEQTAWGEAVKGGTDSMLATIGAFDEMGISTEKYRLGLSTTILAQDAMASAQARMQVASAPLTATLQQSATALGEQGSQALAAQNAVLGNVDAELKLAASHEQFIQAVASGDATQVKAAASAEAATARQKAFSDAIVQGKTATEAGQAGLDAFRNTLQQLADTPGLDPGLKASIEGVIQTLDQVTARPRIIDVDLNDKATVKALALKSAVDSFLTGKPIELTITAIERGFPELGSKIDILKQHSKELQDNPVLMTAILNDLATGDLTSLDQHLTELGGKNVKPTVDADTSAVGAKLQGVQNDMNNIQTVKNIVVTADASGAVVTLTGVKSQVDQAHGTMTIDANPAAAQAAVTGAKVYADTTTGTITIGGNEAPANSKIIGTVATADGSTGTITIDGNPAPANAAVGQAVSHVNSSGGSITIDGKEVFKRGNYGTIGEAVINIGLTGTGALYAGKGAQGGVVPRGLAAGGLGSGINLVGERGPELAIMPHGTRVFSHSDSLDMLRKSQSPDLSGLGSALNNVATAVAGVGDGGTTIVVVPLDKAMRQFPELRSMSGSFLGGRG